MAVAGGSGVTQILQGLEDQVEADLVGSTKMRATDMTTARVSDLIGEKYRRIGACRCLVDEVKVLATLRHHCLRIECRAGYRPAIGLASRKSLHYRRKFAADMSLALDSETRLYLLIALRDGHSSRSGKGKLAEIEEK